ncbi:MAG: hypothetical protein ACRD1N_03640 [Terriglobia bacterium]
MGGASRKWFIVAVIALAIIVGLYVTLERRPTAANTPHHSMSAAERDYLNEVELTNPRVSAATNFLGDTLYYLDGTLVNKGPRAVRQLDVQLTFLDPFGEVVLRQTQDLVTLHSPALKSNQSRPVHLTFEHLPAEWNQAPPAIAPIYVGF